MIPLLRTKIGAAALALGATIGVEIAPAPTPLPTVTTATATTPSGDWLSWIFGTWLIADLDGAQVVPPVDIDTSAVSLMWLNPSRTRLYYWILTDGVVLKANFADRTQPEDVTQIHFHLAPPDQNGPHLLNVFGPPSEDDLDMTVSETWQLVTGIWDDGDVLTNTPGPGDTRRLTDHVDDVRNGGAYLQIHTNRNPTPGELRGRIVRLFW